MLYRMSNSKNSKSGLYKIPITHDELFNLNTSEIQDLALSTRKLENLDFDDCTINDTLESMWLISKEKVQKARIYTENTLSPASDMPNGVGEGERNNQCFKISLNLKSMGYSLDEAKKFIIAWNQTNSPPEEELYKLMRTVEQAYSYETTINSLDSLFYHIREDQVYGSMNNDYKVMYIYLLAHLNTKEKEFLGHTIKPNQWVTTQGTFSEGIRGISEEQVKGFIRKLVSLGRIKKEIIELPGKETGFKSAHLITWLL